MRTESNNRLPLVLQEARTIFISFNETEKHITSETGEDILMYEYDTVRIPKANLSYSIVVSAIISDKYPSDVMEALLNNYLKDPTNPERKQEFDEMQAWRDKAKEVAKLVFAEHSSE